MDPVYHARGPGCHARQRTFDPAPGPQRHPSEAGFFGYVVRIRLTAGVAAGSYGTGE